ncbi:MAG: alpha-E domain-containing protein [Verrucomicrobia bacterium]|nr:alpha-E domain-containing protein [Verrucomicrobiota bacterium]
MQSGGQGKDVWVLSDAPSIANEVVQLVSVRSIKRQAQTLSSHLADNLYWLGRYVERAEILTRTLTVVLKSLLEESTRDDIQAATNLMQSILFNEEAAKRLDVGDLQTADYLVILGEFVVDQIWRSENLASLSAVVSHIQRTRDAVKERISGNTNNILQSIDTLKSFFSSKPGEADFSVIYENLLNFLEVLSGFAGMVAENITRGPDWYFLDLGRRTERAMGLLELLSSCLVIEKSFEGSILKQILDFADSTITYRQRYLNELSPFLVMDLVIKDLTNPRSLAFQAETIQRHIQSLPHRVPFESPHRIDELALSFSSQLNLASLESFLITDEEGCRSELNAFLSHLVQCLLDFSEALSKQYFSVT